ncbi:MAG: hypothetical protein LUC18_01865, partial [Porphyromonadaceae bacterium]|nr:hypothetical protein [Porphyromonadaceae bacterium]
AAEPPIVAADSYFADDGLIAVALQIQADVSVIAELLTIVAEEAANAAPLMIAAVTDSVDELSL